MREALKCLVERLLLTAGPAAIGRMRVRGGALVLAYHNVAPDGAQAGERTLHLPYSAFLEQLDVIVREANVVPLASIRDAATQRRPRVAITFDDAYRGAVTHGVEALARKRLPATIFVAPAFLGGRSFWWDVLAEVHGGEIPARVRDEALNQLAGDDAAIRSRFPATGQAERSIPDHARAADEQELIEAVRHPGITLGSHTWSHPNLRALHASRLDDELTSPVRWLRERFPGVVAALAYPYGLNDENVRNAAKRAGYTMALRVEGGWLNHMPDDPFGIPRLNIPAGLTREGTALRLAGLFSN